MKRMKTNRLFRLLSFTKPWRWMYALGLLGGSFQSFAFNFIAALGLQGLTEASINKDFPGLLHSLLILASRLLILMFVIPLLDYLFESSVKKTTGNIRKTLFHHSQRLSMEYIENQHSGDLISRLTNDIQTAENAYGWQLKMLLMALISGIGSFIIIFSFSWQLAMVAVALGIANALVNTLFIKPLKKSSDEAQKALSNSTQRMTDILAGSHVTRIFNLTQKVLGGFGRANEEVRRWSMRRVKQNSYLNGLNHFVNFMSFVGIIAIGGLMAVQGQLSWGLMVATIQMANGITWMFNAIGNFLTQLQASLAGADRIFEILDMPPEQWSEREGKVGVAGYGSAKGQEGQTAAIAFRDVSFSYDKDNKVLDDLSLGVHEDEVVALVGSSGSGKSTLFKLLLGFYDTDGGEIMVFGKPIREYTLEQLRKLMAYVPQDNYLFSGTIRENIAYGKEGASQQEIEEAAKGAFAHDFIMELPAGYDTQVGERGAHLSGGQRQRITIARAFLKNAPILLLDEATSSLDSESEQQVQKALERLMKGRTTMVVAHRLSTVQNADTILVLENGSVCEQGNHEALMALGSSYARLYNMQFKEVEAKAEAVLA